MAALAGALLISHPGCGSTPSHKGSTTDQGGAAGDDTGGTTGESGSGGSSGSSGKGGASGSSGKGGDSGGSTGGAAGADTGGTGGSSGGGAGGDTGTGGSSGGAGGDTGTGGAAGGGEVDAGTKPKDSGAADMGMSNMAASGGCAGGTCLNPECKPLGTAMAMGKTPSIGFETQPSYIPNDVIVPTFDDTPDGINNPPDMNFGAGDWTRKMVDYFDSVGLHMDFFINGANFCDVAKTPECQETVKRILKNHNPANHTVHHIHMGGDSTGSGAAGSCSATTCDKELSGVESLINTLSMGDRPHLTRFRSPYGEPFQSPTSATPGIAGVVAKYAVHVGWQMDSTDSLCDTCNYTGAQIAKKVEDQIGTGPGKGKSYGIVLMHGTYPWSYDAAKLLFDPKTGYTKTHGFRLGTVEDVICWKYGKHSWEMISAINNSQRAPN